MKEMEEKGGKESKREMKKRKDGIQTEQLISDTSEPCVIKPNPSSDVEQI